MFFQLLVAGVALGGLYSLLAMSIVLIYKGTAVLSIVHGQFVVFGGFILWAFLSLLGLPLSVGLPLTCAVIATMGFLLQRLALQPLIGQPFFAPVMVTIGLFGFLHGVLLLTFGPRSERLDLVPEVVASLGRVSVSSSQVLGLAATALVWALLIVFFRYHRMGLAMRAVAQGHHIAQSTGIPVKRVFSVTWAVSAAIASLAGVLIASFQGLDIVIDFWGLKVMAVVLFGGLESIPGVVVGGIALGLFETLAAGYVDPLIGVGASDIAPYVAMLLILIVRPHGIMGLRRIERV